MCFFLLPPSFLRCRFNVDPSCFKKASPKDLYRCLSSGWKALAHDTLLAQSFQVQLCLPLFLACHCHDLHSFTLCAEHGPDWNPALCRCYTPQCSCRLMPALPIYDRIHTLPPFCLFHPSLFFARTHFPGTFCLWLFVYVLNGVLVCPHSPSLESHRLK